MSAERPEISFKIKFLMEMVLIRVGFSKRKIQAKFGYRLQVTAYSGQTAVDQLKLQIFRKLGT